MSSSETSIHRDLPSLYRNHDGKLSDKWSSYLTYYGEIFNHYRDRPVSILEIGIQNGGSLEIWERFFPRVKRIIGVDINPLCTRLSYVDPRISVVVGDANTDEVHARIMALSPEFDIIIDDGSHQSSDIVRSFALYFPHLAPGGLYVAEDLHCGYMGGFQGGIEAPYSSIAFFKRLADLVNREHWGAPLHSEEILSYFAKMWNTSFFGASLDLVDEVRFRNSVCVVSKGLYGANLLGPRVIAGSVALVEPQVAGINGILHQPTDETPNGYGPTSPRMEDAVANRDAAHLACVELSTTRDELSSTRDELSSTRMELSSTRDELSSTRGKFHKTQTELSATLAKLQLSLAEHSKTQQTLHLAKEDFNYQKARAGDIERQLIKARRRPHKLLAKLLAYRLLHAMSRTTLLPKSMISRFARSAAKRDPRRVQSIQQTQIKAPGPAKPINLIPVFAAQERMLADAAARFYSPDSLPCSVKGEQHFSILLPVYNTPPALLRRCLDTVLAQTYAGWELQVVNDASTSPEVQPVLEQYAARDSRIHIHILEQNSGIAKATQVALEAAVGNYVCLLDHDDELTCDALERVAEAITNNPDVGVVYSDECKLSPEGIPTEVFAKPDWSPALMINCMYIGHLTTYLRKLVIEAGGFRSEFDFSQDYDLALRVTEGPVEVYHIPEILYGWRAIPESAAAGGKSYARKSNIEALQSAANRRGWAAKAVPQPHANVLEWHDNGQSPLMSLVIPSDNGRMIHDAVRSIIDYSSYTRFEILVVTNSALISELEESTWPDFLRFVPFDQPFNFSAKSNAGAAVAAGDILVFYNDDVRVQTPDWMERMIDCLRIDRVGAVGPKLLYENNTIQHAGMVTGVRRLVGTAFHTLPASTHLYYNFAQSLREVSLLCGALIAVRRETFELVGGFDADRTPIYHSDVDLCFKIRDKGLSCLYAPQARLLHIGHVSIGEEEKKSKKIKKDKAGVYMLRRWASEIAADPYFPVSMRDLCYHDSPEPFSIHPGIRVEGAMKGDVLLVSHDMSCSGAPRVVHEMARSLQQEGWFVVVTAPADGPMRKEFSALGITVIIDHLLLTQHNSVRDFVKDYDLVVANTIVTWPLVAQLLGIVPVAWYIHEIDFVDHLASQESKLVDVLVDAETVWAGSELCAQNLRRYRKEVSVFGYGVERPSEVLSRRSDVQKRLAVFASFEPRKGQDLLVEAFASLNTEEREGVSLHIYGRTMDVALREQIELKYGDFPNLVFAGEIEHQIYLSEMAACDMVIIPSRSDTLPLVSLNALSFGIPLMCTRQTGTSEFLEDGVSGYVIPSASVSDITATLRRALAESDKWRLIGAAGEKIFNTHFSQTAFQSNLSERVRRLICQDVVDTQK